jgi:hypothetical protein
MPNCMCECHGRGVYGMCSIEGGCGHLHAEQAASPAASRRCAQGRFCARKEPERDEHGKPTGKYLAAVIETERGLCGTCQSRVARAVKSLAVDALQLSAMLGESGAAEVFVDGSRDLPTPMRLSLEALRSEIDSELQCWAEPVAEVLGVEWDTGAMRQTRTMPRIVRAANLLGAALPTLFALPDQEHPAWADGYPVWDEILDCQDTLIRDGIAGALSLLDLHRRSYAATGQTILRHRLPTPCPWCDFLTLVRLDGSDHVECENCQKTVDQQHYDWFVRILLAQQQGSVA